MNKIFHGDGPHRKTVITYGTFDVLHQGHINLLRRAKELGDYLIVGVTTDNFDMERGKLNTRDSVMKRVQAVKETGYADEVIIEEYKGQKIDDVQRYDVDVFAIGSDWEGYFDYMKEFCEVVYLPRTEGISSTMLREEQIVGIIDISFIGAANCFYNESLAKQLIADRLELLEFFLRIVLQVCKAHFLPSFRENFSCGIV